MAKEKRTKRAPAVDVQSTMSDVAAETKDGKSKAPRTTFYLLIGKPLDASGEKVLQRDLTKGRIRKKYDLLYPAISHLYSSVEIIQGRPVKVVY